MIAYSKVGLRNLHIQSEAAEALANECISAPEFSAIKVHYPVHFYMPNLFIRVGLLVLTALIVSFAFGFCLFVQFNGNIGESPMALLFFFTVMCYGSLEYIIRQKQHFRSGVDDALLWASVACFSGGLSCINNLGALGYATLLLLLSSYYTLRFGDRIMSVLAFFSGLVVLFYGFLELGSIAKLAMPFVIMAATGVLYYAVNRISKRKESRYHEPCLLVVKVVSLLSFYAAGNYFVVREVSNEMFDLHLAQGQSVPLDWLFWAFTCGMPMLYLYWGVQKKDQIILRTSLLLMAVMIGTIRYYYHIMDLEIAMAIGGATMLVIASGLIKYLREPRRGFTYQEEKVLLPINGAQLEALVINQTFATPHVQQSDSLQFGGGSGGGAGAGGSY